MTGKSTSKSKNNKKTSLLGPRLKLEPRIEKNVTPSKTKDAGKCSSKKVANIPHRKDKQQHSMSESKESMLPPDEKKLHSVNEIKSKVSMPSKDEIFSASFLSTFDAQVKSEKDSGDECREYSQPQKRRFCKEKWDSGELKDFAIALQNYGFTDLKKIAAAVKTKNEETIRNFIWKNVINAQNTMNAFDRKRGRPKNQWKYLELTDLIAWPIVRKWKKIVYTQMSPHIRTRSYCTNIMQALCTRFYEEEEEPVDPQVMNVKLIYKYILDCIKGEIPPQLPPKECSLVLELRNELNILPEKYDFDEEFEFIKGFKTCTKFKPFNVKDEFRKTKIKDESEEEEVEGEVVIPIPEEIYLHLSRHRKIVQSLNPLGVPLWLLSKEQEYLNDQEHPTSSVS